MLKRFYVPVLLLALTGCSPYSQNRLHDLRDAVRLSVGVGYGLSSTLSVGDAYGVGAGAYSKGWYVGNQGRIFPGQYVCETGNSFPAWTGMALFPPCWYYCAPEAKVAFVLGLLLYSMDEFSWQAGGDEVTVGRNTSVAGDLGLLLKTRYPAETRVMTGVDASLFLGVVGVRVGFSPVELVDFIGGFVGFDLLQDDQNTYTSWRERLKAETAKREEEWKETARLREERERLMKEFEQKERGRAEKLKDASPEIREILAVMDNPEKLKANLGGFIRRIVGTEDEAVRFALFRVLAGAGIREPLGEIVATDEHGGKKIEWRTVSGQLVAACVMRPDGSTNDWRFEKSDT